MDVSAVSADKLHGRGGIVHLALQSIGQKPNDRHLILVTHEDSGVAVWNFRHVAAALLMLLNFCENLTSVRCPCR